MCRSQRRNGLAFADLHPADPQGDGNALTLDLAHILQLPLQRDLEAGEAVGDLKCPATPSRCHSAQQLPLAGTPLGEGSVHGGVGLPCAAWSYSPPEAMQDFRPIDPLEVGGSANWFEGDSFRLELTPASNRAWHVPKILMDDNNTLVTTDQLLMGLLASGCGCKVLRVRMCVPECFIKHLSLPKV